MAGDGSHGVRWDRLGRIALLFVGVLLVALYVNPLRTYSRRGRRRGTKRAEVAGCSASTRALVRRQAQLRRPAARGRGAAPRHGPPGRARLRRQGPAARRVAPAPRAGYPGAPWRRASRQRWCSGARASGGWPARRPSSGPRSRRVVDRDRGRAAPPPRRPFTTDELAELYDRGTDWCTDLAADVAPGAPWAWDARTVADAAFLRYLRDARDYAGGRRTAPSRSTRRSGRQSSSASSPARRITIWSSSIVTSTGRWPAQCSA